MNRFGLLDQLRENWPRMFEQPRISLLERKTRRYTLEELSLSVDQVLETCQYAPTVRDMVQACEAARKRLASQQRDRRGTTKPKPGDVVDGEQTLTPAEAASELDRMHREHAEAFKDTPLPASLGHYEWYEIMGRRIYVKALRKCAALDNVGVSIDHATQKEMF